MRKTCLTAFLLLMIIGLCACGDKTDEASPVSQTAQLPNPVEQLSRDEIIDRTGIVLPQPEAGEDLRYSIINLGTDTPIVQLHCTVQGYEIVYRAQAVPGTELTDISGMHYDWELIEEISVAHCSGELRLCGDVGCISWLDIVPGIQYSLSMKEDADREKLIELAELLFAPVQGEA